MLRCTSALLLALLFSATTFTHAQQAPAQRFRCESGAEAFAAKANRFLLATLALQPVEATQTGYHQHNGVSLDDQLDRYAPADLAAQTGILEQGRACFATERNLSPEDAADLAMLRNSIDSSLFQLRTVQPYRYHPQDYVEMIGSGLFFPLTQTAGTERQRLTAVVARMEQIPRVLAEARQNLAEADPVFIDTALAENDGDLEVIRQIGERIAKGSPLRPRFDAAAQHANTSLNEFSQWMKDDLAQRKRTRDWRTGAQVYGSIFQFALGPGARDTPQSVLAGAEKDLAAIREQMYTLAAPLHAQWFPGQNDPGGQPREATQNQVIAEVIDRINQDHVEPGQLLEKVQSQTRQIRDFIVAKNLVTLSSRDNMKVVATPEFLRGVYSVAGFHPAPPLDPTSEAEYWVTPISPSTPAAQADSKLREYNNWMLQYLTMHEALPGHYTQFEHADDVQPPARRVLRALLSNGAYTEGWGEYGVKEMVDAGYANRDPRFVLMVLKIRLRVVTNAILDIRMQTMNMTDEQALDLMEHQAFQTHAEAMGKLRRAKLTASQLITYYVGFHQWIDLRDRYQRAARPGFNLKQFNDAALDEGALPIPLLEPLLMARRKR